jgi:uncharacterized membrane protein YeaQ/YmgE (transglycosylase-associated protein family)
MRPRLADWLSHIRMAPHRLLPWAAAALVATIAGEQHLTATAILAAALIAQLLVYPLLAPAIGRMSRAAVAVVMLFAIAGSAVAIGDAARLVAGFIAGLSAGIFWMRGPDGELHELLLGVLGAAAATLLTFLPPPWSDAAPTAGVVCAALALAHLSVWRRRPLPWRQSAAARFTQ